PWDTLQLPTVRARCHGGEWHIRRSHHGPWGNGSPADSGSVSPGSNPGGPATADRYQGPVETAAVPSWPRGGGGGRASLGSRIQDQGRDRILGEVELLEQVPQDRGILADRRSRIRRAERARVGPLLVQEQVLDE